MIEVDCPLCGETVDGTEIEKTVKDPPVPVARRQTAFDATISSLLLMDAFAYMIRMPCCDREILTVN